MSAVSTRWPPFRRTVEDVLNEILRKEKQEQRPKPQNKRLRAVLTREVDGKEVNAKDVVFDWLAKEVQQRDPHEQRTVVAIMDGENKLRDLQELKIEPGDRHLGHLARDRILMGAWPTVFTAMGATRRKRSWKLICESCWKARSTA